VRITLRQLSVFEAVARTGSVAGAAEEIGLSPSAASMSLKDLETHLGVELFARSGRRMLLTDRGRPMLEMARGILVQVADMESLSLPEEVRGRLRIGAAVPVGDYVLPRLCAAFISDRGGVQATIRAALFVWGQPRASLCDREAFCAASRSQPKKIKSSAVLWHRYQRRLQAGDAAVVLTASALPALPIRSRLACYLTVCAPGT